MAVGKGVPIMSVEWVEKCWEHRSDALTSATDENLVGDVQHSSLRSYVLSTDSDV